MKTAALLFGLIWLVGGAFSIVGWVLFDTWRYSTAEGAVATIVLIISLFAVAALIYGAAP